MNRTLILPLAVLLLCCPAAPAYADDASSTPDTSASTTPVEIPVTDGNAGSTADSATSTDTGLASSTPDSIASSTPALTFTLSSHVYIATSTFSIMPSSAYPSVVDPADQKPTITYEPLQLPAGTSTVTWTAIDSAGTSAATTSQVIVVTPLPLNIPSDCTATDTAGVAHAFPDPNSPSGYLAICMLEAAKDKGLISDFELVNDASLGLYVKSIDGAEPGASQYWALWLNEQYTSCGIDCTTISQGDDLSFVLTDWMTNSELQAIALEARSLIATSTAATTSPEQQPPDTPQSDAGGNGPVASGGGAPAPSGAQGALSFLRSEQNADGSFGGALYTDWAAIALASAGTSQQVSITGENSSTGLATLTDYERRAMAQEALGIDPSLSGGIARILSGFDGTQFGDPNEVNDDIFALIALEHAGYGPSDQVISKDAAFVLSRQAPDGSWDGSVDLTAAAIQALEPLSQLSGVQTAILSASGYLKASEGSGGCFGNSFSTSWAIQAIYALGESPAAWQTQNGATPGTCLASLQQQDGGFEAVSAGEQTRIWATAYAIPALEGESWNTILHSFPKETSTQPVAEAGTDPAKLPVIDAQTIAPTSTIATTTAQLPQASSQQQPISTAIPTHPAPKSERAPVRPSVGKDLKPSMGLIAPRGLDQTAAAELPARSSANLLFDLLSSLWRRVISFL